MGYCLGLSLRDLQEMMALTLGEVLSRSACNRIVSSVTARVEAFKSEPLENPPPIIMVDGMWVKIAYPSDEIKADALGRRRYAKRNHKRVMLSALGINAVSSIRSKTWPITWCLMTSRWKGPRPTSRPYAKPSGLGGKFTHGPGNSTASWPSPKTRTTRSGSESAYHC